MTSFYKKESLILRWSTFLLMLLNAWVLKPIVYARAVQPRVERTDPSHAAVRSLWWRLTPVGWMQFMNFMLFLSSNKKNTLPRSSLYLDSFVVMNMLMTVQVKGGQANGDRRANATRLRYWKEISDPRLFPTKIDLVFACFRCIPVPCSLCMCRSLANPRVFGSGASKWLARTNQMVLPKPCATPARPVELRLGTGRQKFTRQVAAFFLRWTCERLLTSSEKRTTRPRRGKARSHGVWSGALLWLFFWISIGVSHSIVLFREFMIWCMYLVDREQQQTGRGIFRS